MWTQAKQNYDKHVKWMKNWKDIVEEEDWAPKVRLVPLSLMGWEASMFNVYCEQIWTLWNVMSICSR
jgi:hypothetical protein